MVAPPKNFLRFDGLRGPDISPDVFLDWMLKFTDVMKVVWVERPKIALLFSGMAVNLNKFWRLSDCELSQVLNLWIT
jgi:hypothetical protein